MKVSTQQINQHFSNHKAALKTAKPVVSSFRKQQHKLQKNNKKEIINYNSFDLVYKMFKSVNKQKVTVDNKIPDSDQAKKLFKDKFKRNKYEKFTLNEHERQLKSVKERIDNCGSMHQRKKRTYDPITHPTYLMRESAEGTKTISIQPFAKTILKKNQPKIVKPASACKIPNSSKYQYGMSPMGKIQTHKQLEFKQKLTRPMSSVNEKKTETQNFPDGTYNSILNYIVNNKVYKDLELRVLYQRLCFKYGEQSIEDIWEKVLEQIQK